MPSRPVYFVRTAKVDLTAFPLEARRRAGHEIFLVQTGREPDDWKPMPNVGAGACEIRVAASSGA